MQEIQKKNVRTMATVIQKQRITPELAKAMLKRNTSNYRKPSKSTIDRYVRDMKNKEWPMTHHGIAFNKKGELVDGQHRLMAVVSSNKAIDFMIMYNAPDPKYAGQNKPRTFADAKRISTSAVATLRRMMSGGRWLNKKMTWSELDSFYDEHVEAITFIEINFKKTELKGIKTASVTGALARAYYSVSHDDLLRFIRVLNTGQTTGAEEDMALNLRNWLIETTQTKNGRGPGFRLIAYRKTQKALSSFVARETLTQLREANEELFDIPHEYNPETDKE